MPKFLLAGFQQARLLPKDDPGVCIALCDLWLDSFLRKPKVDPPDRMTYLMTSIGQARSHQQAYTGLRAQHGPTAARQQQGGTLGLDYDEQTTVTRAGAGRTGMIKRVGEDLRPLGAAATWSMRFDGGGGHAIAGVNRLERITSNIAQSTLHVFDPNVGEYMGTPDLIADILGDLFKRFPIYGSVKEIRRTTVMHLG